MDQNKPDRPENPKIKWITTALIVMGIIMIGIGIARGEPVVVLKKATAICMQCIGIG